ncbi:MAG: response regulator, partial [Microcystaceae cyanobacterium]
GKIHFANSSVGARERLGYLLGHYVKEQRIKLPEPLTDDYQYLCQLWNKKIFSFQQTRSILSQCTQEALVQVLSLPKTLCEFDPKGRLEHLFLNLDLDQIIIPIKHKIRYWWELRSDINSPFQRPLVENWDKLHEVLAKTQLYGQHWIKRFHRCLEELNCLYGIASRTELSTLQLALLLRPLIRTGEIKMLPYQEIQTDHCPLIVSVEHRPNVQRMIHFTLENSGFRSLNLENPFKALTVLLNQQPAAILIDADLPEMNGYQLCSFCRKSSQLKNTPIILLRNGDNIVDTIRARLVGATGSLRQPFLPQALLQTLREQVGVKAIA